MITRKAFTLVELLVVIAIIGLLSTVAVVATKNARVKANNAKRIADVIQIKKAFELANNLGGNSSYPSSGGDVWVCILHSCSSWAGYDTSGANAVNNLLSPYLPNLPVNTAAGYLYDGSFASGPSGPGAYIDYALEGGSGDCGGLGKYWATYPNGVYECMLKLDPI
jgi:prepilin-type N-terminal cleavage/methylation domain-containing protein